MNRAELERQKRLTLLTADTKFDQRTCVRLRQGGIQNRRELDKQCRHQTTHKLSNGKPVKSIELWGDCCDELDILDGKPPRSTLKTPRAPKVAPTPKSAAKPAPVKSEWKGWGKQKTQTQKNQERLDTIRRMIEAREREEMEARRLTQQAPTVLRQETPKPPVMPLEGLELVQDPIQRRLYKNKHNIEHDDFDLGKLPDGTHIVSDNITKKVYKAGKKHKSKAKGKSRKAKGKSRKAKGKSRKH